MSVSPASADPVVSAVVPDPRVTLLRAEALRRFCLRHAVTRPDGSEEVVPAEAVWQFCRVSKY